MTVLGLANPQIAAVLWLLLGILFAVAEGVSVQLIAVWFALGAAGAAITAMFGAPFLVQFIVFIVLSVATLAATRPLLKSKLLVHKVKTNADRVIDAIGVVQETIDNDLAKGRVSVGGLGWTARSSDGSVIEQGSKVKVTAIEGVKVIVERYVQPSADAEQ